jgi:hypothetical protein
MGVGDKMTECDSQDKKDPHRPWLWLFVGFLLSAFLFGYLIGQSLLGRFGF